MNELVSELMSELESCGVVSRGELMGGLVCELMSEQTGGPSCSVQARRKKQSERRVELGSGGPAPHVLPALSPMTFLLLWCMLSASSDRKF